MAPDTSLRVSVRTPAHRDHNDTYTIVGTSNPTGPRDATVYLISGADGVAKSVNADGSINMTTTVSCGNQGPYAVFHPGTGFALMVGAMVDPTETP